MAKPTISVCLIVKNEEHFLGECLQSIKPVADQIVLVDTGSTDKTIAIAERFNAEVNHFTWCDDFAAARNASLEKARGDYILWLDADERLTADSISFLQNLPAPVTGTPRAFQVQINNHTKDNASFYVSTAYRLFQRHPKLRFENRIHERLTYNARGQVRVERAKVTLEHLGYALDEAQTERKAQRNLQLLLRMVKEQPNSAYAHFTLAQQYNLQKKHEDALKHFKKACDLDQFEKEMSASLLNMMAETNFQLGKIEESLQLAARSAQMIPGQVSAYYVQFLCAQKRQQWAAAAEAVAEMRIQNRRIAEKGWSISNDIILDDALLLRTGAEMRFRAGQFKAALELFDKLPQNAEDRPSLEMAVQCALKSGELGKARTALEKLITKNPAVQAYYELLGTVLIKLQDFAAAIDLYTRFGERFGMNEQVTKRLAGLYVKTGNHAMAGTILSDHP